MRKVSKKQRNDMIGEALVVIFMLCVFSALGFGIFYGVRATYREMFYGNPCAAHEIERVVNWGREYPELKEACISAFKDGELYEIEYYSISKKYNELCRQAMLQNATDILNEENLEK